MRQLRAVCPGVVSVSWFVPRAVRSGPSRGSMKMSRDSRMPSQPLAPHNNKGRPHQESGYRITVMEDHFWRHDVDDYGYPDHKDGADKHPDCSTESLYHVVVSSLTPRH